MKYNITIILMSEFMNKTKIYMYSMFEKEYDEDIKYYDDIHDFIDNKYNCYSMARNDCDELLYKLSVDNPFKAYEIFNYVNEKLIDNNCIDYGSYIKKINDFKYFMASEWKNDKQIQ
jgi:hypothetical protein